MALDIDRYAHVESFLSRWDPRLKILSLGIFVFCVALLDSIPVALMGFALACGFLWLSKLPLNFVRGGIAFVLIFLIPLIFIMPLSYPGQAAFKVLGIPFAWEGLRIACIIIIKAVSVVITAYSIFGTSRFDVSMIALQHLKVPKMLVQMLLFTYRYIFVFIAEMRRMDIAMRSRGFVKGFNMTTLTLMGNFVGTLLVRSFERTERVYKAMLSKGYNGDYPTLVEFNAIPQDFVKAILIVLVTILLVVIDITGPFKPAVLAWF